MSDYRKEPGYDLPGMDDGWAVYRRLSEAEHGADGEEIVAVVDTESMADSLIEILERRTRGTNECGQGEELLCVHYECPRCGHAWQEKWSCACDSPCPACGAKDIEAMDSHGADKPCGA